MKIEKKKNRDIVLLTKNHLCKKFKIFVKKYIPKNVLYFLKTISKKIKRTCILFLNWFGLKKLKSNDYWIERYKNGGNSGKGSYEKLAEFKAEILNNFVKDNNINTVIEFGCGDGNQLSYFKFPQYLGFDISPEVVALCKDKYTLDKTKRFDLLKKYKNEMAELSLSLDVIFHLLEDNVFDEYMDRLFNASEMFVVIYSSDKDERTEAFHVRHRKFSDWIKRKRPEWELSLFVPNKYSDLTGVNGSFADFYFYKKKI